MSAVDRFHQAMQAGQRKRYAHRINVADHRNPTPAPAAVLAFPLRGTVFTGTAGV